MGLTPQRFFSTERETMISSFENRVPTIPSSAWVHESAQIIGSVTLGANASVWPCAVLRGDIAAVHVGTGSNIQDGAVLHVDYDQPCEVGEYSVIDIGPSCTALRSGIIAWSEWEPSF